MNDNDAHDTRLAAAAAHALRRLGVRTVELGAPADGGSERSSVIRAMARGDGPPLPIILKAPTEASLDGFTREAASLSLIRDHELPGVVRLLGVCESPAALVLEDLGTGPTVADLLLGTDAAAAARGVLNWARTVARLHAGSGALGQEFAARLARYGTSRAPAVDYMRDRILRHAEWLPDALAAYGVTMGDRALSELRALAEAPGAVAGRAALADAPEAVAGRAGLSPGDGCPDNAIYRDDGALALIDFEFAAFRPAAWDAAYLTAPFPTCWCSWALPTEVRDAALAVWDEEVPAEHHLDPVALARATLLWPLLVLAPRLNWIVDGRDPRADEPGTDPAEPATKDVILHRLANAAAVQEAGLPALQDLAARTHDALQHHWGDRTLALAPAFR